MADVLKQNRISSITPQAPLRYFLSACVIVRQSSDIIPQFIVQNYAAGVDHFYVYGDDEDDPEEMTRLRKLFSALGDIITYIEKGRKAPKDKEDPKKYVQMRMYRNCLQGYGRYSKWMTFIDTDEFFETYALPRIEPDPTRMPRRAFLHDILSNHEAFPVLCVRWRSALTNGRVSPPKNGELLSDLFSETCKISLVDNGKLAFKKTILQPRYVDMDRTPKRDEAIHQGFAFHGRGLRANISCKTGLGHNLEPPFHIVHYWSRDLTSFFRKIRRGRPRKTVPQRTLYDLFERERMCKPESIESSSHIRHDYIERIVNRLPDLKPRIWILPTANMVKGSVSESASAAVSFCDRNLNRALKELARGNTFNNYQYCQRRWSKACALFRARRSMRWPFPWVEFLTKCDDLADRTNLFA